MRKFWYELTDKGKKRRLNEVRSIIDRECLTHEFWEAYDRKDYDKARVILVKNNCKGGKIGYHYSKNHYVNQLLAQGVP